jgi:uncharacterized damage-inducible protein DinB
MTTMNVFVSNWLNHRKVLLALLDTVENEHIQYKPWEKAMSLSTLVLHINGAMDMFAQTVKNGVFTPPSTAKQVETIEELKTIVAADTASTKALLESLSDEQLDKEIDFHGMNMPGIVLLENAKDHEIHHKGQLFIYLRLLGIETLPFFVSR